MFFGSVCTPIARSSSSVVDGLDDDPYVFSIAADGCASRVTAGAKQNSIFAENVDTMPFYYQGSTNGCGTTSLAMLMAFLQKRPVNREAIDREICRGDGFSSPTDLVRYAREADCVAVWQTLDDG
ncbi:hypothetical protein ACFL5O_09175 [Myxococcota bacterium]